VTKLGLFSPEKGRLQGDVTAAFSYLQGVYKKDGERLFTRDCSGRTKGNGYKLEEGEFRLDIKQKFCNADGETLEQVDQRGGRCPIPGDIHGPVGRGSDLVEDVPAHCS